ncbi:MAG: hypothetical protein FWG10_10650 [Eubacteriaceae bacterium]|nr:hypothetical protein [Eubacteriaceae bacterium]
MDNISTNFSINYELKSGFGEDSPPLLEENIFGVFDGMGGAGGISYVDNDGIKRTSAYLASREVKIALSEFFAGRAESFLPVMRDKISQAEFVKDLESAIYLRLAKCANERGIKENIRVRSSMIKILPTTIAAIIYTEDDKSVDAFCLWVGDSRCYCIDDGGLYQLTKDDLSMDNDAMENLLEDSPMSNCIHLSLNAAGQPDYHINHAFYTFEKPCVLFAATDGCFGFVKSPMHFEWLMLNSIALTGAERSGYEELGEMLKNEIVNLPAADDCTMAGKVFAITGKQALSDVSLGLYTRYRYLSNTYIQMFPIQSSIGDMEDYNQQMESIAREEESLAIRAQEALRSYFYATIDEALTGQAELPPPFSRYRQLNDLIAKNKNEFDIPLLENELDALCEEQEQLDLLLAESFEGDFVSYIASNPAYRPSKPRDPVVLYSKNLNKLADIIKTAREDCAVFMKMHIDTSASMNELFEEFMSNGDVGPMDTSFMDSYYRIIEGVKRFSDPNGKMVKDAIALKSKNDKLYKEICESHGSEIERELQVFLKSGSCSFPVLTSTRELAACLKDKIDEIERLDSLIDSIDFSTVIQAFLNDHSKGMAAFAIKAARPVDEVYNELEPYIAQKIAIEEKAKKYTEDFSKERENYTLKAKELWNEYKPGYESRYNSVI